MGAMLDRRTLRGLLGPPAVLLLATGALGCGGGDGGGANGAGKGESGANGGEGTAALPVVLHVEKPASSRVRTTASEISVEGHVTPGSRVTVNGKAVRLRAAFYITRVKDLPFGQSRIEVRASKHGLRPASKTLAVTRVRRSAGPGGRKGSSSATGVAANPPVTPRKGVHLSPELSKTEADVRRYLKRNFGKEDWYGSITGLDVTTSGVIAKTSLAAGDADARPAASAICRALHFARLPLPNFVKAKNGAALTAC
jgi:hypothetical protein